MKFVNLQRSVTRAFTLIEVVLAVGIFSIAAVSGIAMFAGLIKNAGYIRERDNAIRLSGALDDVLLSQNMDKITEWLDNNTPLFAYTFLANASNSMQPAAGTDYSSGSGSVRLVPSLRPLGDAALTNELRAIQGSMYRVVLSRSKADLSQLNPSAAYIVVLAQFYPYPSANPQQTIELAKLMPVHSVTMTYLVKTSLP